ncbi:MAG TPA: alpha/beta hydrolase [Prolixibacteraceae bacterium]|nr:alpha/beta hydrolase [Prolixibacteraceae bacterium]
MKKILVFVFSILMILYMGTLGYLYLFQEKLIFFPQKLEKNYQFNFAQNYQEINIKTYDQKMLNGLLFKADSSKGLVFYLHGNAGSLSSWGKVAKTYTDLNYDVFMLDYPGFGKSEGTIVSLKQLYRDLQTAYDEMLKRYEESKIIVLGYSMGTGLAAYLAATNHPKLLILLAPYYSLTDMMKYRYPLLPDFILRYKIETDQYIQACKMPIVIFHGDQDQVIYYGSSLKLKRLFKKQDVLITLTGKGHDGMTNNLDYKMELSKVLQRGLKNVYQGLQSSK